VAPVVVTLANDRAWRVRWSLCHQLKDLFPALYQDNTNPPSSSSSSSSVTNTAVIPSPLILSLTNVFENLLNDAEPEVRAACGLHISTVCQWIPKALILSKIIPTLQRLVSDNTDFVRAVIAAEISQLSIQLGREDTVKLLLPLLLSFLRDDASDVRLQVISHLEGINATIGVELLSQNLLPAIISLAQDPKWRVKLVVMELMPMIGALLGAEIFNANLVIIVMNWCVDSIYSIRKASTMTIRRLYGIFGEDWMAKQIIPKLEQLNHHASHFQRMTSLHVAQVLLDDSVTTTSTTTNNNNNNNNNNTTPSSSSTTLPSSSSLSSNTQSQQQPLPVCTLSLCRLLIPLVLPLAQDPVANVRMTVAKILKYPLLIFQRYHVPTIDSQRQEILAVLKSLVANQDRDVRYYAQQTSSVINS
jgi:hypothetical protein